MERSVPKDFPRDLSSLFAQSQTYFNYKFVLESVRAAEQFLTETLPKQIAREASEAEPPKRTKTS